MPDIPATAGRPFHWPVGPTPEARADPALPDAWYVANPFGRVYEPRPRRAAVHPGLDLNLRSGGDSDLDAPVHACGDGIVTASGSYAVWGNIVLVEHTLPDGRKLWSQYAHLNRRTVAAGQAVARGQPIGTVGKGERGRFTAHLHFEIRIAELPAPHWPGLQPETVRRAYADPAMVIAKGLPAIDAVLAPPPGPDARSAATDTPAPTPWRASTWPGAPCGGVPATRHPVGKGVLALRTLEVDGGDPAVVARRARALGLAFAGIALLPAGAAEPAVDRGPATEIAAALAGAGIAVWGLAAVSPGAVEAVVEAVARWAGPVPLAGWIIVPVGRAAVATASAAARLGLACHVVANGAAPERLTGNALLLQLLGARMTYVASREERNPGMQRVAEEVRASGGVPYVIPLGASNPLGALGFARGIGEVVRQTLVPDVIVHASSSGGTQAGLIAGCALYEVNARVVGISADDSVESIREEVLGICEGIEAMLDLAPGALGAAERFEADASFVGDGYGIPTDGSREAQALAATHDAFFVDHWYTAKALAAVIAYARRGEFRDGQTVMFWHTGGQVGLFA